MKKTSFFLFLLLLSVIGSVSAYGTDISEYYVVLDDTTLTTANITSEFDSYSWREYTPSIVGIINNRIYFDSEKDLIRFCNVLDLTSSEWIMAFDGEFLAYSGGNIYNYDVVKVGVIHLGTCSYVINCDFEIPESGFTYILGRAGTSMANYGANGHILLNGQEILGSDSTTLYVFDKYLLDTTWNISCIVGSDSLSRTVSGIISVVMPKGYNATGEYFVIYQSPNVYDISVYTEPETSIYEDEYLWGTTDNGGFLVLQLPIGEHTLKFVKEGYWDVTQTIDLESNMDLNVTMESTHLSIPIEIIDSEGGLTGVNFYIDGVLTGTVGNNQDVILPKGTHELIFEKPGYWNETRTVTVDETLTDLSIRMYPESVFFKISNTPVEITTYSNSEVNIALNIDPNDYAYGVKLYLTGQEVLDVRDSSNVQISKQDSYYLLDDFSSDKTVNVKINSGTTLGTNSLAVRVTGYNSIGTEFVTDTTIDYEIVRLPLSLTVPNWCIGSNSLTVIETEGDSRTVTIKVEDSEGNIIYTDTYTLEGFETHKFNIDFEETGDYKLYIQSGDLINTYIDVSVNNPVTLETKTITANEGSTATATVSIENPFTEPQYYRITIEGDPLTNATRVDFSISPGSSKSQSISFTLLDELDYDSYSLPLKVYLVEESGMTEIYSDSVILNIGSSGSFIPFIDFGDDGIIDTVITLVVDHPIIPGIIIIAGLGVFISSGRKKGKKPVKTIKKPIVKKGGKKGGK
jgi:hypothetical protein